uniref:SSD domain-containing protein n=1 Tax=Syphacia muris TaxID=451379 RepID=A0A0N5AZ97_9BILA
MRFYVGRHIEKFFSRLFYLHGKLVGTYPSTILFATLILASICAFGILRLKIDLNLYDLFVPLGAPVRYETERFVLIIFHVKRVWQIANAYKYTETESCFQQKCNNNTAAVDMKTDIIRFYAVHNEYKNLLHREMLSKLYNYSQEIFGVSTVYNGKRYTFDDFCKKESTQQVSLSNCSNELNIWLKHAGVLFDDGEKKNNPNLQLSYPVVYGVNVTGTKHEIVGAKVLTLHWLIKFENTPEKNDAYMAFRKALGDFWNTKGAESDLKFIPHNDRAMDEEMNFIIFESLPYAFPVAITLMLFVVLSNCSTKIHESKPVEAFFAVISVILSLICTLGISFGVGMHFNPVSCSMPFLILAVGVDDAFLMLGAWRTTKRSLPLEERMALTMADAGVSITVTSATNFGCFALGYFLCATPAVGSFCLLTSFGVLMDYLFQITFFASIMIYGGRKEDSGGFVSSCYKSAVVAASESNTSEKRDTESKQKNNIHITVAVPFINKLFGKYYAPFILRKEVRIISWIIFLMYFLLGVYGCSKIIVDISPKKYIRDNSPLQTFIHLADKYIWADNVMPKFYIMNPPDLRDPTARTKVNELIYRLEHTEYSIGRVSTNFWVWEYQRFLNDYPGVDLQKDFYKKKYLKNFLTSPDNTQYNDAIKIDENVTDGDPCVRAFTFQTSFYGLDSWDKRQAELYRWRKMIAEYPEYDMFLADIFTPFLIDQRKTIAPSSMQSIGSAIAVMAIISTFFLPDMQSVFFMTWSLLSISMGVCGGLSLWGSDLDSVSTGCIVMAIGLAVDFSVHVCYRYHRSDKKTGKEKVYDTMTVVAWPILQAGLSTLIGLMWLPFVQAYMIRVFYQTVVLVNVIGLTHALVWLPQLISSLDPCDRVPLRIRHMNKEL